MKQRQNNGRPDEVKRDIRGSASCRSNLRAGAHRWHTHNVHTRHPAVTTTSRIQRLRGETAGNYRRLARHSVWRSRDRVQIGARHRKASYTTTDHAHAMMEPFASIAAWKGDQRTMCTWHETIDWTVQDLSKTLGIPKEKVRVLSPYIGGGFGGKLWVRADAVLAALAARTVGRPVKVALPRPLMMNNTHASPRDHSNACGSAPLTDGKLTTRS